MTTEITRMITLVQAALDSAHEIGPARASVSFGIVTRPVFDALVQLGARPRQQLHRRGEEIVVMESADLVRGNVCVAVQLATRPATAEDMRVLAEGKIYAGATYEEVPDAR